MTSSTAVTHVTAQVTPETLDTPQTPGTSPVLAHLGERGRRLWQALHAGGTTWSPGHTLLIEEACRLADRLERYDRILRGDAGALAELRLDPDDGPEVVLVVNSVATEARLTAGQLKQIVSELRQGVAPEADKPPTTVGQQGGGAGAGIFDLAAAAAKRRAASQS